MSRDFTPTSGVKWETREGQQKFSTKEENGWGDWVDVRKTGGSWVGKMDTTWEEAKQRLGQKARDLR